MRNFLIAVVILLGSFFFVSQSFAAIEYSDGSVQALYHLDGDSVDASGNGHNGTDTGMTYPLSGKFLNAGRFINTYPNNNASISATVTNLSTYSINFWVLASSTITGDSGLISSGSWSSTGDFKSDIDNNSYVNKYNYEAYGDNPVQDVASTNAIATNSWTMVTLTLDASSKVYSVYINGSLDHTDSMTSVVTVNWGSSLYLGTWLVGANYRGFVSGYLDEVSIFNKVLSSSEISALWNSGYGETICTAVGCAGGGIPGTNTTIVIPRHSSDIGIGMILLLILLLVYAFK